MASISTSTSFGSFAAWMQVLAGFGDGSNYFQRWDCRNFFLASPILPFHTPRSSQKICPYLLSTHWLWLPSPMTNLRPPRRFQDSWCIEPMIRYLIQGREPKTIKSHMITVCSRLQLFFLSCRLELDHSERSDQGLSLHGLELPVLVRILVTIWKIPTDKGYDWNLRSP